MPPCYIISVTLIVYAAYAFKVSTSEYVWTERPAAGVRKWAQMASSADGMKLMAGTWGNKIKFEKYMLC